MQAPLTRTDSVQNYSSDSTSQKQSSEFSEVIEDIEQSVSLSASIAATPSLSIVPGSITPTSVTLNCVFPTSGARGNAIGLWDFNNGETIWNSNYGNNTDRQNGNITISGLIPGGLYQVVLMWSTDGGDNYGGNNSIHRRVKLSYSSSESLTTITSSDGKVSAILETTDKNLASSSNFNTWMGNMSGAYAAYKTLTGYAPYEQIKLRSTRTSQANNLPDGQNSWYEEFGWSGGNPSYIYQPFYRSLMLRLGTGDWSDTALHEMSHDFDYYRPWVFDAEFFAYFKEYYVVEQKTATVYREDMMQYFTGSDLINFYRYHPIWGYDTAGFNEYGLNFPIGLSKIFVDIKKQIGNWGPFISTFNHFNQLPSGAVPYSSIARFNVFVTKLRDASGFDVIGKLTNTEKGVIQTRLVGTVAYGQIATIETREASVSGASVTLNGYLNSNNGYPVGDRGFYYGTSSNNMNTQISLGSTTSSSGSFDRTITLVAGQTYFFRAYTVNAIGTSYGAIMSFTVPYSITYYSNGSTNGTTPAEQTFYAGQRITLRTNSGNLSKVGHTFAGWNTSADGSGTNYSAGQSNVLFSNGHVRLYAKWNVNLNVSLNQSLYDAPYNLFKVTRNPTGTPEEVENTTAFRRRTNESDRMPIARVNNTPTPTTAIYSWEYIDIDETIVYKSTVNSSITVNDNTVKVGMPDTPGKYTLNIYFSGTNVTPLTKTFTVYITFGANLYTTSVNKPINVDCRWLEAAFSTKTQSIDTVASRLNQAIYKSPGLYRFGHESENEDVETVIRSMQLDTNCTIVSMTHGTLMNLLGVPAQQVTLSTSALICDDFMMLQNQVCFGANPYASNYPQVPNGNGYYNGLNLTRSSNTSVGSEHGAWFFGATNHRIAYCNNIYYDPTLGRLGFTDDANVYALLDRMRDQLNEGSSIQYRARFLNNIKIAATIETEIQPKVFELAPYPQFNYWYVFTNRLSALSEGGEKTIVMPQEISVATPEGRNSSSLRDVAYYKMSWSAVSNENWITIESIDIAQTESSIGLRSQEISEFDMLTITIDPNPSNIMRIGTITVGTDDEEKTITVYQDGAAAVFNASPTTFECSATSEEHMINISSNVTWHAYPSVEWVNLSFASGTGNDELLFVTEDNDSGAIRTATITLTGGGASKTITIIQTANTSIPTEIQFDTAYYEATISDTDNTVITIRAKILDQYGNNMSGCNPVYSIVPNHPGVTINGSTGELLIYSSASVPAGTINIKANYGTLTQADVPLILINTVAYAYDLFFSDPEGYFIDAYEGIDIPVEIYAYVMDSQGMLSIYPELVSLVYMADSGVSNETGVFTKEDLNISPGEEVGVTVIATFIDGSTLYGSTVVYADYIQPTLMPTRSETSLEQVDLKQNSAIKDQSSLIVSLE